MTDNEMLINFAQMKYRETVQALGDDPYGVIGYDIHGDKLRHELGEYVTFCRNLGRTMGLDFKTVLRETCNAQEIARLASLCDLPLW